MKPLVDLPDPETVVRDALLDAGHAIVKTEYPSEALASDTVWLQVDLEASNTDFYPVTERAQVRVVAHAARGRRGAVKDLAQQALADLYVSVNPDVAGIVPISGRSAVSTDPATKNVMCWVMVRVDLLATTVAP
jgi:hypothetical protein